MSFRCGRCRRPRLRGKLRPSVALPVAASPGLTRRPGCRSFWSCGRIGGRACGGVPSAGFQPGGLVGRSGQQWLRLLAIRPTRRSKGRCAIKPRSAPELPRWASANLIARIRIAGERFWSDYLTPEVWVRVDRQSASELVDAFSTEYLLRQHVLSTWSTVALALCKVVEREIARAIFVPWKRHFHAATWVPPRAESEKSRKRLESRAMTFKTLQSCSGEKGHSPTLGQLLFIAKFWNDPLMEQCTEVFRSIRAQASRVRPTFSDDIVRLVRLLEQPFTMNESVVNIPDARNRSAHPREDDEIDWNVFIGHIKDTLGKPPAELLKLLVSLTAASNAAQQGAPGDAPQAARP
jgi:hypothetical protein